MRLPHPQQQLQPPPQNHPQFRLRQLQNQQQQYRYEHCEPSRQQQHQHEPAPQLQQQQQQQQQQQHQQHYHHHQQQQPYLYEHGEQSRLQQHQHQPAPELQQQQRQQQHHSTAPASGFLLDQHCQQGQLWPAQAEYEQQRRPRHIWNPLQAFHSEQRQVQQGSLNEVQAQNPLMTVQERPSSSAIASGFPGGFSVNVNSEGAGTVNNIGVNNFNTFMVRTPSPVRQPIPLPHGKAAKAATIAPTSSNGSWTKRHKDVIVKARSQIQKIVEDAAVAAGTSSQAMSRALELHRPVPKPTGRWNKFEAWAKRHPGELEEWRKEVAAGGSQDLDKMTLGETWKCLSEDRKKEVDMWWSRNLSTAPTSERLKSFQSAFNVLKKALLDIETDFGIQSAALMASPDRDIDVRSAWSTSGGEALAEAIYHTNPNVDYELFQQIFRDSVRNKPAQSYVNSVAAAITEAAKRPREEEPAGPAHKTAKLAKESPSTQLSNRIATLVQLSVRRKGPAAQAAWQNAAAASKSNLVYKNLFTTLASLGLMFVGWPTGAADILEADVIKSQSVSADGSTGGFKIHRGSVRNTSGWNGAILAALNTALDGRTLRLEDWEAPRHQAPSTAPCPSSS
ncbi:hypothetical protein OC834_005910 [Tilletia horrida]|nr:hypothetical protein OC834_005910 [Tilletia horrida]